MKLIHKPVVALIPFLLIAIAIALPFTTKGENPLNAAGEAFAPLVLMDEIKQSQETLKNLETLIKLSAQLNRITQDRLDQIDLDPNATAAAKADARADQQAASNDLIALLKWHSRIEALIVSDHNLLAGAGVSDRGRDAAKDAAQAARDSAANTARQTGADAARGSMDHCPPMGGH